MRAFRFLNLAILSMLVGFSTLVYAQDDKQQDAKPPRQEEAKPQPKQEEMKPPRQDEAKPANSEKQEEKQRQDQEQKESRDQVKTEQQVHPQPQSHPEERVEHAQPAGRGARIPDDKFRAHFGHGHTFRAQTVIVEGRPQFQYSGYSFQLVDAWPADWAYTDDCYIDYIDGEYFLFDLLHPGVRIAVFVVM